MSDEFPTIDKVEALTAAAGEAQAEGDMAHAKALRQAAIFMRRKIRERKHGAPSVAIWLS